MGWIFDLLNDSFVLPKAFSIMGSIGLCICDTIVTAPQVFAGLPELTEKIGSAEYIKLGSRIFLSIMYLAGFNYKCWYSWLTLPMIIAILVGYQTKFVAGIFVIF